MEAVFQRMLSTRPSIAQLWNAVKELPGGPGMFSRLIGQLSPHSGSLGARVLRLEDGGVEVFLKDRRILFGADGSLHVSVLANLAELTTGLAVQYVVDRRGEAVLKSLTIEALAPSMGSVTASCDDLVPVRAGRYSPSLVATIRDDDGVVVARATTTWDVYLGR